MLNAKRISEILLLIIIILWIVGEWFPGAFSIAVFLIIYGLGGLLAYVIAIKPMFCFIKSKIESRRIIKQIPKKIKTKKDC